MSREVMQQALEALENCATKIDLEWGIGRELEEMRETGIYTRETTPAIHALRAALAEPEPEREPWLRYDGLYEYAAENRLDYNKLCSVVRTALVSAPTPRKPLTDEAIRGALEAEFLHSDGKRNWQDDLRAARAVIAAYEANQGEQK